MNQQGSWPPATARFIPTRSAAIALLAIDALLLLAPFMVRWESWFAFAYIPLLLTVAWGFMLGGIWKTPLVVLVSVGLLSFVTVGIALALPDRNAERLGVVFVACHVALAVAGTVVISVAVRGWVQFFRGRIPASVMPPSSPSAATDHPERCTVCGGREFTQVRSGLNHAICENGEGEYWLTMTVRCSRCGQAFIGEFGPTNGPNSQTARWTTS